MGSVPPLLSFLLMVVSGWVYRHQLPKPGNRLPEAKVSIILRRAWPSPVSPCASRKRRASASGSRAGKWMRARHLRATRKAAAFISGRHSLFPAPLPWWHRIRIGPPKPATGGGGFSALTQFSAYLSALARWNLESLSCSPPPKTFQSPGKSARKVDVIVRFRE